ncbi:type IV pilin biogenesis protein [Planctomycetes bacterium CA13]|uniref:Type IV pilin biogenesis protein n=1 Tax=Novipirellula herctigrandis TaxID=2527986 RepID=A0A5C5YPI0_9BACT|nr:type IV pilin biogenesis protein [Planctomycetes bacterium CA13]
MSTLIETIFPTLTNLVQCLAPWWRISPIWSSDTVDARQRSLLRILATAHKERLDPAVLVDHLANEHRWSYKWRLKRLARRLREGTLLVDALEQTPDALSDPIVLAVRFATQCGTLDATYSRLIGEHDETDNRLQYAMRHSLAYVIVIGLIACLITLFQMTFIIPTIVKMERDFSDASEQISSASVLKSLISVSHFIADYFPMLLMLMVLIFLIFKVGNIRRLFRRGLAGRWFSAVAKRRSAQLLELLADSLEAGRPLSGSFSTLARYHFDTRIRHKLLIARNEIEQGAKPWDSLAEVQLISPAESKAIAHSSTKTDRVWTLRRVANWQSKKLSRSRENRSTLFQPIAVMALASFVLWIGYAYFQFLYNLVQNLAKP